ncbi:helix-turn-helix domain-containing protein [Scytonema sp. UIC 10036]|uniref:helix-turn-helix domain-containing protein n=1 Tax=Scytonema sp. UIC 10036 TaxID=2304196 RepID=UPI0012DA36C2|nr:helix-turn-helix transcriptional regulator [Scytonema sp. UIC 10036]MUH01119.1 helix-turn-helix domain-containing protein [Scytonema sp. UIC 10036]
MSVRNKIKQFIDERGITVYRFWQDTGVAQRTAYDLYNDPSALPNPSVLTKICDTYEVQPGELLFWTKDVNPE